MTLLSIREAMPSLASAALSMTSNVPEPRSGDELWSAPRLDLGVAWALPGTRLRVGALLTGAAPLQRGELYLRDLGTVRLVHRPPSVLSRLAAGVDVSFD